MLRRFLSVMVYVILLLAALAFWERVFEPLPQTEFERTQEHVTSTRG